MPLPAMASAMDLIRSSLTLQPNLFQLFQPIGGVSAKLALCALDLIGLARSAPTPNTITIHLLVLKSLIIADLTVRLSGLGAVPCQPLGRRRAIITQMPISAER